jgi:TfoX C-terminal domain
MSQLTDLPNIGSELEKLLIDAGINSKEKLKAIGAEKVFLRLNVSAKSACINKLYAIEGAIQEIRWHGLDKTRKEELKVFLRQFNDLERK